MSQAAAMNKENGSGNQNTVAETELAVLADWDTLSQAERERALRTVALHEMEELGIDGVAQLQVVTAKLDESTLGSYNDETKTVRINYEYLHDASLEEMLETVLHEMHHAYAHYVVQTLDFSSEEVQNGYYYKQAREWKENFENYRSASNGYYEYLHQPIEVAAREYASERAKVYMSLLPEQPDAASTIG